MNQSDIRAMRERLQSRQAENADRYDDLTWLWDGVGFVLLIALILGVFFLA